ncbi:MAG: hypothetical protein KatS3mg090_0718 [Patescibacteria group bacterium]|nr:MAG: hypothetical protein KatS3mg090_0718 [Patescibacteria group bacterium]
MTYKNKVTKIIQQAKIRLKNISIFKTKKSFSIRLLVVIIIALFIRLLYLNWDNGFLFHPDERMLMFVTASLKLFENWNPNFFNYGSLPIYILRLTADLVGFITRIDFNNLSNLVLLARVLSTIADSLTIIIVYKISYLIFSNIKKIKDLDFWASAVALTYAFTFFTIQNSHFFISDVFLTLFCTLTIYLTIKTLSKKNLSSNSFYLLPISWSAVITTKISGVVFVIISVIILWASLLYHNKKRIKPILKKIFISSGLFIISAYVFMPYAFLDFTRFKTDILNQLKMNSDPYVFPYTLQYVNTMPYLYYLKNIFYWGMGPILSSFSFIGTILYTIYSLRTRDNKKRLQELVFLVFYLTYFLIIGRSAVKFMRYMLPIYPFLAFTAVFAFLAIDYKDRKVSIWAKRSFLVFIIIQTIFLTGFLNIYKKPNTRIQASLWIHENIPEGKTLAIEHWDDQLPSFLPQRYQFVTLPIYELPDNTTKWRIIEQELKKADYLILASNRLYTPLLKLSDCQKHKKCYPKTAEYYTQLFTTGKLFLPSETIKFKLSAEFVNYPEWKIPFTNISFTLNDQSADESFTVYDHPRVIIFEKEK